jgi:hypothetical protein
VSKRSIFATLLVFNLIPVFLVLGILVIVYSDSFPSSSSFGEYDSGSVAIFGQGKTGEIFVALPLFVFMILVQFAIYKRIENSVLGLHEYVSKALYIPSVVTILFFWQAILWGDLTTEYFQENYKNFALIFFFSIGVLLLFLVYSLFRPIKVSELIARDPGPTTTWGLVASMPFLLMGWKVQVNSLVDFTINLDYVWTVFSVAFMALWLGTRLNANSHSKTIRAVQLTVYSMLIFGTVLAFAPRSSENNVQTTQMIFLVLFLVSVPVVSSAVRDLKVQPGSWKELDSPISILISLLALVRIPELRFRVSSDDFHFGESLVSAQQFLSHGVLPFIDLPLTQGLSYNFLPGLINHYLFAGNPGTLGSASAPILVFLLILVAFHLIRDLLPFPIMIVSAIATYDLVRAQGELLVLAIAIAFVGQILKPNSRHQNLRVFAVPLGMLCILIYPATGVASAIVIWGSALLISINYHFKDSKFSSTSKLKALIALTLSLTLGFFTVPALLMTLEQSSGNLNAYGISQLASWNSAITPATSIALFLLLAAASILATFLILIAQNPRKKWVTITVFMSIPVAWSVLLLPRSLGRIDPQEWSHRPTSMLILIASICVPFAVLQYQKIWGGSVSRINAPILIFALILGLNLNRQPLDLRSLEISRESALGNNSQIALANNSDYSIWESSHLEFLDSIRIASQEIGVDSSSIIELTNRSAIYTYLDWKIPTDTNLSRYAIATNKAEQQFVEALEKSDTSWALISANTIEQDGLSMGLRNPIIYEYLLSNFTPIPCRGLWFAIKNSELTQVQTTCSGETITELQENKLQNFSAALFTDLDLNNLPVTWGAGLSVDDVATWQDLNDNNSIALPEKGESRIDVMLSLKYECSKPSDHQSVGQGLLGSDLDSGKNKVLSFVTLPNRVLVIPVFSNPSWISESTQSLELDLNLDKNCAPYKVNYAWIESES